MLNRTERVEHDTDFERPTTIQGKKQGICLCQDSFIPITSFSFKLQLFENKMGVKM